jgi:hypothetical protein
MAERVEMPLTRQLSDGLRRPVFKAFWESFVMPT